MDLKNLIPSLSLSLYKIHMEPSFLYVLSHCKRLSQIKEIVHPKAEILSLIQSLFRKDVEKLTPTCARSLRSVNMLHIFIPHST